MGVRPVEWMGLKAGRGSGEDAAANPAGQGAGQTSWDGKNHGGKHWDTWVDLW